MCAKAMIIMNEMPCAPFVCCVYYKRDELAHINGICAIASMERQTFRIIVHSIRCFVHFPNTIRLHYHSCVAKYIVTERVGSVCKCMCYFDV